jgi:predicted nucleic acid-binding protein
VLRYFDSNYILKCYVNEPGAEHVRELASQGVATSCSQFGRLEVLSALHQKVREASLTRAQLKAIWTRLEDDEVVGVWTWIAVDRALEHAVELAFLRLGPEVYLRTGDAIHLATASLHGCLEIHSQDRHLLLAAAAFGLRGVDVVQQS